MYKLLVQWNAARLDVVILDNGNKIYFKEGSF